LLLVGLAGCEDVSSILPLDAMAGDAGTGEWQQVAAPGVDFFAVAGSGPDDDVILVGSGGTIVRWDGQQLVPETSGVEADLHGVCAVSRTRAYAVGAGGTIVRWDGAQWNLEATPTQAFLTAVYADEKNAWAVGENGTALTFDGNSWITVPVINPSVPTPAIDGGTDFTLSVNLLAVARDSEVFAVGSLGTVVVWDGQRFARRAGQGFNKTLAGATGGRGGMFIVGMDGSVLDANQGLVQVANLPPDFLRGVSAVDGAVWVVGFDGLLARIDGGQARVVPLPQPVESDRWLYSVFAVSAEDVWVAGASGLVLHGPAPLVRRDLGATMPDGGM
jgi:hypothetical protein